MTIKRVSLLDNLRLNLGHVLPYFLRGIFFRRRFFYSLLSRLGVNPYSHAFAAHLVRKHGTRRLMINMAGRRTLLLLDPEDVAHVLARSPDIYAENDLKRRGMSHFQPCSVTVSRGDAWRRRRELNEKALDSESRVHARGGDFAEAIRAAIPDSEIRTWAGVERLFDEIMQSVVFGRAGDAEQTLSDDLRRLMRKANRVVFLRPSSRQARLAASIDARLRARGSGGLAGAVDVPFDNHAAQAQNQVPHWMFAIRDTLAVNTARALALITAHHDVHERVRADVARADLGDAERISELTLLEGCLQEAMRLWPTTPLLSRESIRFDRLGGRTVPAGTQVVIFNQYLHREAGAVPEANAFRPERWSTARTQAQFNHLSNGRQVCAGKNLALLLGTAALANLVDRRYVVKRPRIDRGADIPHTFNYFRLRLATESPGNDGDARRSH